MHELDEFGFPVWDFPLPLYAPNDPIAYDTEDTPPRVVSGGDYDMSVDDDIDF